MSFIRRTITGAAVLGITVAGLAATAAPASAQSIKSNGTVTRAESNRVHRGVDKQKCLTIRETQKIVGARGTVEEADGYTVASFNGKRKTSVQGLYVYYIQGCAYMAETDLTHGRWQYTFNEEVIPANWEVNVD